MPTPSEMSKKSSPRLEGAPTDLTFLRLSRHVVHATTSLFVEGQSTTSFSSNLATLVEDEDEPRLVQGSHQLREAPQSLSIPQTYALVQSQRMPPLPEENEEEELSSAPAKSKRAPSSAVFFSTQVVANSPTVSGSSSDSSSPESSRTNSRGSSPAIDDMVP